jgi:toxin-antitoxin system PIN domain toxin
MKVVDANVLIYAVNEDAVHHHVSNTWLRTALAGDEEVGLAWLVLLAFLRVSTRWVPSLTATVLGPRQAFDVVHAWIGSPAATVLEPGPRHLQILQDVLESADRAGDLVPDAHLAALAIEHGAEVITFDTDFARFPGLRWRRLG